MARTTLARAESIARKMYGCAGWAGTGPSTTRSGAVFERGLGYSLSEMTRLRKNRPFLVGIGAAIVFVAAGGIFGVRGLLAETDYSAISRSFDGRVHFDADDVPTVQGRTWEDVYEKQGYVTALQRMFQMDLIRRKMTGRLAEWFGPPAAQEDRYRREEGWARVAAQAVQHLTTEERAACEAYARGVNRFIEDFRGRWSAEYRLLGEEPESWSCADSTAVSLSLADTLSTNFPDDGHRYRWRAKLGRRWFEWLFSPSHVELPGALPERALTRSETESAFQRVRELSFVDDRSVAPGVGSNAWAWAGDGSSLLASDPHLGYSVPQIWHPVRLRVGPDDWTVGVAVPGLPGVGIGARPEYAWAFTNLQEDQDDLVIEETRAGGREYRRTAEDGTDTWHKFDEWSGVIRVRFGRDIPYVGRSSDIGPIISWKEVLGDKVMVRQWVGFRPGSLHLPVLWNQQKGWSGFNGAMDHLEAPIMNAIFASKEGVGIRASGRPVVRRTGADGACPLLSPEGRWGPPGDPKTRPRTFLSAAGGPVFVRNANEWYSDRVARGNHAPPGRSNRIAEVLRGAERHDVNSFRALQLDTHATDRYALWLWLKDRAGEQFPEEWNRWNGDATAAPALFSALLGVERALDGVLLARVQNRFSVPPDWPYVGTGSEKLHTKVLRTPGGLRLFGLNEPELVDWLLRVANRIAAGDTYQATNIDQAQHPLAFIPGVGRLFHQEVSTQLGYPGLVRTEGRTGGASMRFIWDVHRPLDSQWSFPVGQSGHIADDSYAGYRARWAEGSYWKVLPKGFDWGVPAGGGRSPVAGGEPL